MGFLPLPAPGIRKKTHPPGSKQGGGENCRGKGRQRPGVAERSGADRGRSVPSTPKLVATQLLSYCACATLPPGNPAPSRLRRFTCLSATIDPGSQSEGGVRPAPAVSAGRKDPAGPRPARPALAPLGGRPRGGGRGGEARGSGQAG